MSIRRGKAVADALAAQGLLPTHCKNVELFIPPDGAMVLRYEVYVSDETLPKLAAAFAGMADALKAPTQV